MSSFNDMVCRGVQKGSFDIRKKGPRCLKWGHGLGVRWLGQCLKENLTLLSISSLSRVNSVSSLWGGATSIWKGIFSLLFIRAFIWFYTVSVATHASLCGQPQSPDGRTPWKHRRLKNKTEEGIHIYWYCYLHSLGKNKGFPLLKFCNVLQVDTHASAWKL